MNDRVIFHCDANSFYASVEVAHNPEYANMPVAVSGNPKTRTGIILTKNQKAKEFGVLTGETIWQAKQKCPNLICLPPHHKLYELYSKKLKAIYSKYTDKIESFGIDECWLDVTDTLKFFSDKVQLANKIRQEVKDQLNITISVGVSFGKLFAKLGSDLKKPDATTVIDRSNFKQIIYPMPLTNIIGIGKRLNLRFNKMGIFKLGQIIQIPDNILQKKFGIIGLALKQKLLGNDTDLVKNQEDYTPAKSVGNGTTTIVDIYTRSEVLNVVTALTEEISTRLRRGGFLAKNISVSLKTAQFEYLHGATRMPYCTNNKLELIKNAMLLIDSFCSYNQPLRAIRICTFNLSNSDEKQTCMFEDQKKNVLDETIDQIRQKYGYYSIAPATLIKNSTLDKSKVEV